MGTRNIGPCECCHPPATCQDWCPEIAGKSISVTIAGVGGFEGINVCCDSANKTYAFSDPMSAASGVFPDCSWSSTGDGVFLDAIVCTGTSYDVKIELFIVGSENDWLVRVDYRQRAFGGSFGPLQAQFENSYTTTCPPLSGTLSLVYGRVHSLLCTDDPQTAGFVLF